MSRRRAASEAKEELERIAIEIRDLLRNIPGSGDVEFDAFGRSPLLEIEPDRDALRRYNMQAGDLNHAIATALAGEEVGSVIEGNRRFPIVVRLAEDARRNVDTMKRLPVRVDDGGLLTLSQVAKFQMTEQVGAVTREAGQRRGAILVNLRGRDVEGSACPHQDRSEVSARLSQMNFWIRIGQRLCNALIFLNTSQLQKSFPLNVIQPPFSTQHYRQS